MYTLTQLKNDKDLWRNLEYIPVKCSWCFSDFETKYGTLYNIIRRDADGIFCSRNCVNEHRIHSTQIKYNQAGGKECKRCGDFLSLEEFSAIPHPPFFRSECKKCHNFKPARQYNSYREKAVRENIAFELSLDNFVELLKNNCFYCGDRVKQMRLERLDYQKGFVVENLLISCRECQKLKNGAEHHNFIDLCFKISNHLRTNNEKK